VLLERLLGIELLAAASVAASAAAASHVAPISNEKVRIKVSVQGRIRVRKIHNIQIEE
jgi:hypothetical protein